MAEVGGSDEMSAEERLALLERSWPEILETIRPWIERAALDAGDVDRILEASKKRIEQDLGAFDPKRETLEEFARVRAKIVLCDSYAPGILRKVLPSLRRRAGNPVDAEDLVQETYTSLADKRAAYDPERGELEAFFRFWADLIVKRHLRDRSKRGRRERPIDTQPDPVSPAADPLRASEYGDILHRVFGSRSAPHALIAFGFLKLLRWDRGRMVRELSDRTLDELLDQLVLDYSITTTIPFRDTTAFFEKLRLRLRATTAGCTIGQTKLGQYFGTNPQHDISRWCSQLLDAVRKEVRDD